MSSLTVHWAQKDFNISLPTSNDSSLTAGDLTEQLQWSDEQFLNLIVIGLKSRADGNVVPFTSISADSTFTHLPNWSNALKTDDSYEIVVKDVRESDVSKLSDTQIAEIKKEFDSIDKDLSGEISIEEAKAYFGKKTADVRAASRFAFCNSPPVNWLGRLLQHHERMNTLKKFRLEAAASDDEKASIERKYDGFKQREQKFNDSRLAELLKKDTDGDGTISWQEFLVSEASLYLIRNSLRSN